MCSWIGIYSEGVAQCQDGGLCGKWKVSLIIFQTLVCEDKEAANYWCVPGYEYTVRVWHDVRRVDFV